MDKARALGVVLRRHRQARGLSREQVAERLKERAAELRDEGSGLAGTLAVSAPSLGRTETGRRSPTMLEMAELGGIYEVPLETLIDDWMAEVRGPLPRPADPAPPPAPAPSLPAGDFSIVLQRIREIQATVSHDGEPAPVHLHLPESIFRRDDE